MVGKSNNLPTAAARNVARRCYSRWMSDPTRLSRTNPQPKVEPENSGVSWKRWALGVAILLLAIIAFQNSQQVQIKLLVVEGQMPLIVGLLIAGILGAIIGYIAPLVRRGRRQDARHED